MCVIMIGTKKHVTKGGAKRVKRWEKKEREGRWVAVQKTIAKKKGKSRLGPLKISIEKDQPVVLDGRMHSKLVCDDLLHVDILI